MEKISKRGICYFILFVVICWYPFSGFSQQLPANYDNKGIYDFLDELANECVIEIQDCIKPYSRKEISNLLKEALNLKQELNPRMQKQLDFYWKDFRKDIDENETTDNLLKRIRELRKEHPQRADLFYYRDKLFNAWINPIGGGSFYQNQKGSYHHYWNGLEGYGYIDRHWGVYVSFRDNRESLGVRSPAYLNSFPGIDNKSGSDFSDMRGGASYGWSWGSISFMKDHFSWGDGYNHSVIFSGRIPTIPYLSLNLKPAKWLSFHYIHAWLVSGVVDSNSIAVLAPGVVRQEFYPKFLAANMYTVRLFPKFFASMGNSMIYSNRYPQPAYLIPFILFKSVEHTIAASNENNAQIFMNISSRNIKHLHLYGTFYVDEVNFGNIWDPAKHSNWFAYKAGARLSNFPVNNLVLTTEYSRVNPMVYKHYYPTSTFASNNYNLGFYLQDNSQQLYLALQYKPMYKLRFKSEFILDQKGPDYPDIRNDPNYTVGGKKFMTAVEWQSQLLGFQIEYELFHDAFVSLGYNISNVTAKDQVTLDKYTPAYYQGKTNTLNFRINFGF